MRLTLSRLVHWSAPGFVVARDDQDLTHSAELLVLPLGPGEVRLARATVPRRAESGEWRGGRWTRLAPATCRLADGTVSVAIQAAAGREAVLLAW